MSVLVHTRLTHFHPSTRVAGTDRPSLRARIAETLRLWRKRIREKRALERLDERDLHDIGVSFSDVYAELNRPFWRAPPPG
jgi:uncharacterized protein YjiS (DUF1127 family)